ncbi:MAG: hypothetical protein ABUS54_15230 [Actinomycetota bacterium]
MPATIRLTREGVGIELRRGTFEVIVDSHVAGSIEPHETIEIPTDPGQHTVQLRSGRYSSQPDTFQADDGEVVAFRCHGAMVWPRYVASIVKPDLAISLKRG